MLDHIIQRAVYADCRNNQCRANDNSRSFPQVSTWAELPTKEVLAPPFVSVKEDRFHDLVRLVAYISPSCSCYLITPATRTNEY